MGLNNFFKFVLMVLANLFLYFIVYYALKMEKKSSIPLQVKQAVTLKQDIFVDSEQPNVIKLNTGDVRQDEVLRLRLLAQKLIFIFSPQGQVT